MDYLRERYKGIRLLADDNPWLVELEYEHADQYERLMEAERILEEALERAQQAGVREREALDKVERQRAAIKKI